MNEKSKNIVFYSLIALVILAGIILRVLYFLDCRPFWNDESALALNILNRNYFQLFAPLDYYQASPPMYAVMCKLCLLLLKKAEFALRLPALLCSVISLPVFFQLSKKILKTKTAVIFSMLIFALNYQLIYYAQELKHYSCDVLLFVSILLLYFYIDFEKLKTGSIVFISLFLALVPWFSYTSVIAQTVLFILLFPKDKKKTVFLFSLPLISLITLMPIVHRMNANSYLRIFWQEGFINANFSNLALIIKNNYIFYFLDFPNRFIVSLMFLTGFVGYAFEYKRREMLIIFLPLIAAVLMSYVHFYPLYLRTSLYLFPIFILIISKPIDMIKFKTEFLNYLLIGFLFAHFTLCTLKTDFTQIIKKEYYQEITPSLLAFYKNNSKKDDILVVTNLSRINFEFYKRYFDLNERNVYLINMPLYEKQEIVNAYSMLPKRKTYYVLLTHSGQKKYELENLKTFAQNMKNYEILQDRNYNALIKFHF